MLNRRRPFCESVPRRGFTLIEMMAVVTAGSVLLGVGVTTIHLMLRSERNVARGAVYSLSLARLSRLVPQDVHAATVAELVFGDAARPARLDLTLPGGRSIRYEVDAHSLNRIERDGEQDRHRDVFHFPEASTIRFEREHDPDLIRVVVERPAGSLPIVARQEKGSPQDALRLIRGATRTVSIAAVLSRDHRFETPSSENRP